MLFGIATKFSRLSAVKVLTANVMEETNEKLPNFALPRTHEAGVALGASRLLRLRYGLVGPLRFFRT